MIVVRAFEAASGLILSLLHLQFHPTGTSQVASTSRRADWLASVLRALTSRVHAPARHHPGSCQSCPSQVRRACTDTSPRTRFKLLASP